MCLQRQVSAFASQHGCTYPGVTMQKTDCLKCRVIFEWDTLLLWPAHESCRNQRNTVLRERKQCASVGMMASTQKNRRSPASLAQGRQAELRLPHACVGQQLLLWRLALGRQLQQGWPQQPVCRHMLALELQAEVHAGGRQPARDIADWHLAPQLKSRTLHVHELGAVRAHHRLGQVYVGRCRSTDGGAGEQMVQVAATSANCAQTVSRLGVAC